MVSVSFIYRIRKSIDYKNDTKMTLNEICQKAEGGCGSSDNELCCACKRNEDGQLYQPEVCPKAEGGCGNCNSRWCCDCKRNELGRLYQPEECSSVEVEHQCDHDKYEGEDSNYYAISESESDDEIDSNNGFTDSKVYYGKFTSDYFSLDDDLIKNEILPILFESLNNYNKQNNLELIKRCDLKIGIIGIESNNYYYYSSKRELGCFDFYYLGCNNTGTSYVNGHKI